jgi:hypothetical protein
MLNELRHEYRRYLSEHPGHPLGPGMPLGRSLRIDVPLFDGADPPVWPQNYRGESHRMAWERIIRADPCAYCGRPAGTVDHIEPRNPLRVCRGLGGVYSWMNFTAACESCNGRKKDLPLLLFLRLRAPVMIRRPTKEDEGAVGHTDSDRDHRDPGTADLQAVA